MELNKIIVGLPGQTFESFIEEICDLLNLDQHNSINIYQNKDIKTEDYRKKYEIITKKIDKYPLYERIDNNTKLETEEIVISTNTMPRINLIKSNLFGWLIQTFHCLGLCQFISRYLNKKYNIEYKEIYLSIWEFAANNGKTIIGKEFYKIKEKLENLRRGKGLIYIKKQFGDINWTLDIGSFLSFIINLELFYRDILDILKWKFSFIEKKELVNLILFNRFLLKTPMNVGKIYINEYIEEYLEFLNIKIKLNNVNYLYIKDKLAYNGLADYPIKLFIENENSKNLLYSKEFIGYGSN